MKAKTKLILNVGAGPHRDLLPAHYKGWEQKTLDIDPGVKPDYVCDARDMHIVPSGKFDAVMCSHALEHFYRHDVLQVLQGFHRVLNKDGFAQVAVPDVQGLLEDLVKGEKDLEDTWYMAGNSAISFHDVLYGWNKQMVKGNLFYAHKCGFTEKSMARALRRANFSSIMTARDGYNLHAFAFKVKPPKSKLATLGL